MVVWTDCYRDRWQGMLPPQAFTHPAKAAKGLLQRILQHGFMQGYWQAGSLLLDPFGGIGTTALLGTYAGLRVVSVELEPRFHALAEETMALHRPKWLALGRDRTWPVLVQGDSRELSAVLQAGQIVPPYTGNDKHDYRITDDAGQDRDRRRGYRQGDGSFRGSETYGHMPGQMGLLETGRLDAVLSSPPYAGCLQAGRSGIDKTKGVDPRDPMSQGVRGLEAVAEGYGLTSGQLGNSPLETFWSAAGTILRHCQALLVPGGVTVWILKGYVRDNVLVDFPGDWQRLGEAVGFQTVEVIHASLIEEYGTEMGLFGGETMRTIARKSFFRRLAERKGAPAIDYEVVLVQQKGCSQ